MEAAITVTSSAGAGLCIGYTRLLICPEAGPITSLVSP